MADSKIAHGIPNLLDLTEAAGAGSRLWDQSLASDDEPLQDSITSPPPNLSPCEDDGSDFAESDARLKTDIERVGTTVYGLPLYHFRYKTGEDRFEGVMAQDVLGVMPDAVATGENGFYRVNYRKLGIAMTAVRSDATSDH